MSTIIKHDFKGLRKIMGIATFSNRVGDEKITKVNSKSTITGSILHFHVGCVEKLFNIRFFDVEVLIVSQLGLADEKVFNYCGLVVAQ